VTLEFDGVADLDLYVTDPRLETVYFGNTPSSAGAWLSRDVRCEGTDAPRREVVRFERPDAGTYRIGVDHVKACHWVGGAATYSIRVVAPGGEARVEGRIEPSTFNSRALEFDWPGDASTGTSSLPQD